MSKRKPASASKHARRIAAKPQRAAQAIVRSPRNNRLRPVAGSAESSRERHDDANEEARLVEKPATALRDDYKQPTTDSDPEKSLFSSAAANVKAYQAKLLEVTQANMQFAFEFGQRLAAIRSPFEYFGVVADFTSKRIDMFRKHSKELSELRNWR